MCTGTCSHGLVTDTKNFIHGKEKEKLFLDECELRKLSLHSKMMLEAVDVVQRYWTDVSIHDKRFLNRMPAHSTAIWGIHEMGSYMSPLFASLPEKRGEITAQMPSIAYLLCRGKNKLFNQNTSIADSWKFFLLIKGSNSLNGLLEPIDYDTLFKFVFSV